MKNGMRILWCLTASACTLLTAGCSKGTDEATSRADAEFPFLPYLGQPVPGLTPELFAPGIVNTDAIEFNGVFSPDGREFPGDVSGDMVVSPDGQELYFLGQHPNEYAPEEPTWDIWVSHRVDEEWTPARPVPPPISTEAMEVYPVVVGE